MPIRIEDVPNFRPTRLNQATMDPRVAGAPGAALQGLAKDIASVSQPFADIANRLQDVKNADTEMRIRTAWEEGRAALGKQMTDDPGGAGFLQRVDAFSKETSALLEAPGVPPEVRDRLRGEQQRMVHGMRIHGAEQASRHIVTQGRAAFQQRVALAVEDEDGGAIDREVDSAMARGVVPVAEGEKVRAQAKTARTDHQVVKQIHANPGAWIRANTAPNRDAPDFDEVKHANRMTMAKQLHLTETEFTRQEVRGDILSGKVTRPEEIDARTKRLNPGVAVQLKEELSLRVNRQEAARLRTPEVQKELAGGISSRLLEYTLDAADYDSGFTGIAADIGKLADGPVKDRFLKELGDAREGKQQVIRTRTDRFLKAIDDEWRNHGFGRRMDPSVRVGPPAPGEDERNAAENRLAEQRYGEAKSELIQWSARHPTATETEMEAKALELMKAYPREASSTFLLPAVPGAPGMRGTPVMQAPAGGTPGNTGPVEDSPVQRLSAGAPLSSPSAMPVLPRKGADDYEMSLFQLADDHASDLDTADERNLLRRQVEHLSKVGRNDESLRRQSMNMIGQLMDRVAVKTRKDVLPAGKARKDVMKEGLPGSFFVGENPDVRGNMPKIEVPGIGNAKLKAYEGSIRKHAAASGVDPLLIQAILYMEESHGYYDAPLDAVGRNKSIRPMNINVDFWGSTFGTREDMKDADKNIQAGAAMLGMIHSRLPKGNNDVASIATLYNNINATKVSEYGARVARIYEEFKRQGK